MTTDSILLAGAWFCGTSAAWRSKLLWTHQPQDTWLPASRVNTARHRLTQAGRWGRGLANTFIIV